MNSSNQPGTLTLGLFEKRIDGDDCLMELARRRFLQADMGAEMHAGTPEQLVGLLKFRPGDAASVVVHLPRDFQLGDARSQERILDFAARFAGRIHGLVIHDHSDMAWRREDYFRAAREMESRLAHIDRCPMLFVEYAVGLEPNTFAAFFDSIRELTRISACIDIGHLGIRQARAAYSGIHPGQDICELKSRDVLPPQVMADVEVAVSAAPRTIFDLVASLGALGKPVHFHLHDAHPLSTFSPFGVSDHLSFLAEIPLHFEYRGLRSVPLMFGPVGLRRIVGKAIETIGRVSFTLEIHPIAEGLSLGDAAPLFGHWLDKTNAEQMNHWLSVLSQNHALMLEAIKDALRLSAPQIHPNDHV
jgi:hypothetical protein